MGTKRRSVTLAFAVLAVATSQPVHADEPIEVASIAVPSLDFVETPEVRKNYNRIFYFHRSGTTFVDALSDIVECDAYGRALPFKPDPTRYIVLSNSPIVAGIGTPIANLLSPVGERWADKMFGAPWRRKTRRNNLRVCMGYKGYQRYGLTQAIWASFNFDEANKPPPEDQRRRMLIQQAKIASGPAPSQPELK